MSRALALVILVTASPAWADSAADHVARGEELARQDRFTEAIAEFKRADAIEKRANHACLIALAYSRREMLPQAEVYLSTCHERATPEDPLPDWVEAAERQLSERIDRAPVARVRIVVEPSDISGATQLEVSSFLPDEQFSPRTIHLPLGKHLITARAPGREKVERAIEIDDKSPRSVVISFDSQGVTVVNERRSKVPTVIMGVGAATLVGAVLYHAFVFKPARDQLVDATDPNMPDPVLYDMYSDKFDTRRTTTIALYGAGAALVVTGLILRYTLFDQEETTAPMLTSDIGDGRLILGVQWAR